MAEANTLVPGYLTIHFTPEQQWKILQGQSDMVKCLPIHGEEMRRYVSTFKVDAIEGPVSCEEFAGIIGGRAYHIISFGDNHDKHPRPCPMHLLSIKIAPYLDHIFRSQADQEFEVFVEIDYLTEDFRPPFSLPASQGMPPLIEIQNKFWACLDYEKTCAYPNVRFHYADLRGLIIRIHDLGLFSADLAAFLSSPNYIKANTEVTSNTVTVSRAFSIQINKGLQALSSSLLNSSKRSYPSVEDFLEILNFRYIAKEALMILEKDLARIRDVDLIQQVKTIFPIPVFSLEEARLIAAELMTVWLVVDRTLAIGWPNTTLSTGQFEAIMKLRQLDWAWLNIQDQYNVARMLRYDADAKEGKVKNIITYTGAWHLEQNYHFNFPKLGLNSVAHETGGFNLPDPLLELKEPVGAESKVADNQCLSMKVFEQPLFDPVDILNGLEFPMPLLPRIFFLGLWKNRRKPTTSITIHFTKTISRGKVKVGRRIQLIYDILRPNEVLMTFPDIAESKQSQTFSEDAFSELLPVIVKLDPNATGILNS